jgi:hypothetical protein
MASNDISMQGPGLTDEELRRAVGARGSGKGSTFKAIRSARTAIEDEKEMSEADDWDTAAQSGALLE